MEHTFKIEKELKITTFTADKNGLVWWLARYFFAG